MGLAEHTQSHRYLGHPLRVCYLTNAQMGVDGGVAGGACEVLILAVGDVLVRSGVTVFLGQAKVDDVDQVALLAQPHQEVVWLHVSVDEVLGVDVFDAADLEAEAGEDLMSALTGKHAGMTQILSLKCS